MKKIILCLLIFSFNLFLNGCDVPFDIDKNVRQIYDLELTDIKDEHKKNIYDIMNELSKKLNDANILLRESEDCIGEECRDLFCTGCIIYFFNDENDKLDSKIIYPDRGCDYIYIKNNPFKMPDRTVFCPGNPVAYISGKLFKNNEVMLSCCRDVCQLKDKKAMVSEEISKKYDESIEKVRESFSEYDKFREAIEQRSIKMKTKLFVDPVWRDVVKHIIKSPNEEKGDSGNITPRTASYADDHLFDAECGVVDSLINQLEEWKNLTFKISHIYPIFCVDRDPCRSCLLMIRDYLTAEIIVYNCTSESIIQPIVCPMSIYDEKGEKERMKKSSAASSMVGDLSDIPENQKKKQSKSVLREEVVRDSCLDSSLPRNPIFETAEKDKLISYERFERSFNRKIISLRFHYKWIDSIKSFDLQKQNSAMDDDDQSVSEETLIYIYRGSLRVL
ncbi:MAG: hypothetical protein FADNKDHG_01104 [Holosporales bacterium]